MDKCNHQFTTKEKEFSQLGKLTYVECSQCGQIAGIVDKRILSVLSQISQSLEKISQRLNVY